MAERVLLIGWDGADWGLIDPLLAAGRMPNLASLIESGVRGTLAAPRPLLTPMLWTTIATGKPPHAHGVVGHNQPWVNRRGVSPVTASIRTCAAIWDIVENSNAIAWPVSHPVAHHGGGVIVSDRYAMRSAYLLPMTEPEVARSVHPPVMRAALDGLCRRPQDMEVAALRQLIPRVGETDPADRRPATAAGVIAETMTIHGITRHVLEQIAPSRLTAVCFPGLERLSRIFMELHPPRLPFVDERDFALFRDVMTAAYELHDRVLGSLIGVAGDDATIVLVSDHGFHHDEKRPNFSPSAARASHEMMSDTWHRPEGIVIMSGPHVRQSTQPIRGHVLDVVPSVLALLGRPKGADMPGRAWHDVLELGAVPANVPSYDGAERRRHASNDARDEAERTSDDAIAHLLGLGYTEPPDPATDRDVEQCEYTNATNLARSLLEANMPERAAELIEPWLARRPDDEALHALMEVARPRD